MIRDLLVSALMASGAVAFAIAAQAQTTTTTTVQTPGGSTIVNRMEPEFRTYVTQQKHPSFKWSSTVRTGEVLPESGVTYHMLPERFGKTEYR